MTPQYPMQVDATMIVDQIYEFTEDAGSSSELEVTASEAVIDPIYFLPEFVCDASATFASLPVRTFTILTCSGPAAVCAQGQLLEADADLFRLYNWENGQKNCVGLFDRREVIALFEVSTVSPSNPAAA